MEVFVKTFDVETAYQVIEKRKGRWFDPALVRIAGEFKNDEPFWQRLRETGRQTSLEIKHDFETDIATPAHIDAICDTFARIVDAKSSFTLEHSERVTDVAIAIGKALALSDKELTILRRAALLHDVGKLGVPNTILDKPGKLTPTEWETVKRHPYYTQQILSRIPGFERLADIASAHHERLDGTGYFRGLSADRLDRDMRILAVADVYDALSAARPYRPAMPREQVFAILNKEARTGLDPECVRVVEEITE